MVVEEAFVGAVAAFVGAVAAFVAEAAFAAEADLWMAQLKDTDFHKEICLVNSATFLKRWTRGSSDFLACFYTL